LEDGTLDYERVPEPAVSDKDRAYLRFVETGNLIVGGFVLVLFSAILGFGVCLIPVSGLADEPGESGLRLVARIMATGALGAAFGAAVCVSGRRIRARTRRRFSVTVGVLQVALGTIVITSAALRAFDGRRSAIGWSVLALLSLPMMVTGMMTVLVLTRSSVRSAYGEVGGRVQAI
jgi:hypothetical protein